MITTLNAAKDIGIEIILRSKLTQRDPSFAPEIPHALSQNWPNFGLHSKGYRLGKQKVEGGPAQLKIRKIETVSGG